MRFTMSPKRQPNVGIESDIFVIEEAFLVISW